MRTQYRQATVSLKGTYILTFKADHVSVRILNHALQLGLSALTNSESYIPRLNSTRRAHGVEGYVPMAAQITHNFITKSVTTHELYMRVH